MLESHYYGHVCSLAVAVMGGKNGFSYIKRVKVISVLCFFLFFFACLQGCDMQFFLPGLNGRVQCVSRMSLASSEVLSSLASVSTSSIPFCLSFVTYWFSDAEYGCCVFVNRSEHTELLHPLPNMCANTIRIFQCAY